MMQQNKCTAEEKNKQQNQEIIEDRFPNPTTKFSIGKIDAIFKQSQRYKLLKQKEKENQLMHNYFQQIWKTQEGLTKDLVNIYYHDQDQIR